MPDTEVIEEKPLTLTEVSEQLDQIQKRDRELNFRASRVRDYINLFITKKDLERSKKLREELENANIPRLKDKHIVKILDFMPQSIDELKLLFMGDQTLILKQEELEKILSIIKNEGK